MKSILKSLKLLSDPTRLRILMLLREAELSVADLQAVSGMAQSRISTQLGLLKGEGLVTDKRVGKHNMYSLCLSEGLMELAVAAAGEVDEVVADRRAVKHLLRKRKDSARAYFDELAGQFGKAYVPGRSWKGLAEGLLKVGRFGVVVDLGAGEGTLAQLIAPRADKVLAVDNSPAMVEYGRGLAARHGLGNLDYLLGDLEDPPVADETVDLVCLSQALHHAVSPQRALQRSFEICRVGGQVMVLDLLEHRFEEARELYQDLWLGFAEAELAEMLENAGFRQVITAVVDEEPEPPHFKTLLATGIKEAQK